MSVAGHVGGRGRATRRARPRPRHSHGGARLLERCGPWKTHTWLSGAAVIGRLGQHDPARPRRCSEESSADALACTTLRASLSRRSARTRLNASTSAPAPRRSPPARTAAGGRAAQHPRAQASHPQPVADAVQRGDLRDIGQLRELAADPRDVHVERVVLHDRAVRPSRADQLLAGEHLPGLGRRARRAGGTRSASASASAPRSATVSCAGSRTSPPSAMAAGRRRLAEQRVQPGDDLFDVERLGHVVIAAGAEAAEAVGQRVAGGQEQHGRVRFPALAAPGRGRARRRRAGRCRSPARRARSASARSSSSPRSRHRAGREPFCAQAAGEHVAQGAVVFDDQQGRSHVWREVSPGGAGWCGRRSGEIQAPSGTLARMPSIQKSSLACALLGAALLAGCGSSSNSPTSVTTTAPSGGAAPSGSSTQAGGGSAGRRRAPCRRRRARPRPATFRTTRCSWCSPIRPRGYSIKYPEGWTQSGCAARCHVPATRTTSCTW